MTDQSLTTPMQYFQYYVTAETFEEVADVMTGNRFEAVMLTRPTVSRPRPEVLKAKAKASSFKAKATLVDQTNCDPRNGTIVSSFICWT